MLPLPVVMLLPPLMSTPCAAAKVDEAWRRATPCTVTLPLVVLMVLGPIWPLVMTTPLSQVVEVPRMSTLPVALAMRAPCSSTSPPSMRTLPPAPASLWPTRVSTCTSCVRITVPVGAPGWPLSSDTLPPSVTTCPPFRRMKPLPGVPVPSAFIVTLPPCVRMLPAKLM
ncbi:hypothetical protein FQZ97_617480 [compost metagenome]